MKDQVNREFLRHYEPVHQQFYLFCRAISGSPEDTDDLIQDTILNVLEGFHRIRNLSSFKSYLFSIASNLNKMKLRRNKFSASFNDEEVKQIVDYGQDQETIADFKIVYEKILSLPQKTAETIILFHISDLSIQEIHKIQGGSLSAVKSRLQRGREKVLAALTSREQVKMALILLSF